MEADHLDRPRRERCRRRNRTRRSRPGRSRLFEMDRAGQVGGHWSLSHPRSRRLPRVSNVAEDADRSLHPRPARSRWFIAFLSKRTALNIRRVAFDVTGLPPTSPSSTARANGTPGGDAMVDYHLARPPSASAWPWPGWMPAATATPASSTPMARDMWPWRDWVIDAYNRNMPRYDQFATEQLAGDLAWRTRDAGRSPPASAATAAPPMRRRDR